MKNSQTIANHLKALIIDYELANKSKEVLFGNEIMFGSMNHFADLVMIGEFITAFEIKAQNDTVKNLKQQLMEYTKVFDFIYIVITENHYAKAIEITRKDIGIIIIRENDIIEISRLPKKQKRNLKKEILKSIPANYLRNKYQLSSKLSAYKVREKLNKNNLTSLKRIFVEFLNWKLRNSNNQFRKERGKVTHFEDVYSLSNSFPESL